MSAEDRGRATPRPPDAADADRATVARLVDALLPAEAATNEGSAYPVASAVGIVPLVLERIGELPREQRTAFERLLRIVDRRGWNLLLHGSFVRFRDLDPRSQAEYLRRWSVSRWAAKRRGFQAIKQLAATLYFSHPTVDGTHPLWRRIGYEPPVGRSDPGPPPIPVTRPIGPIDAEYDVCVIGSGAGGSVIAARLAAAGRSVAVLEAGAACNPAEYPRIERDAQSAMFAGRGTLTTSDASIALLAGATLGGSTAVNWMTCLPPRPEARREWADATEDPTLLGAEFDRALSEVSRRLDVGTAESDVRGSNDVIRRGCRALGYVEGRDWSILPRNARGCRSRCGFCVFGCPYGARRGAYETYLADAVAAGARIFASTTVDELVVERGRAREVRATYRESGRSFPVRIRAPAIVLAAGALETPAILLRSGLSSPGIGRGLRLDPTTAVAGEFPTSVRPWDGPMQTVAVVRFQATDPGAHGPWIEAAPTHPGLAAAALPWEAPGPYRRRLERLDRVATPIVLVRDVGEGRVRLGPDRRAMFDYTLTRGDRSHLAHGIVQAAWILRAAGATRISSLHTPPLEVGDGRGPISRAQFDEFTEEVERRGIRASAIALFSAHPMGSARAGTDPRSCAADPTGRVYGAEGLWIGDGSILPSAPGANPMISIMAFAHRTADRIRGALGAR